MNKNFRFAVMILMYDSEQFILRTIENCAPFVEKIYVVYSPVPWSAYNKEAREKFNNPTDPDILKNSKYVDKVELIIGEWETEEEQRNGCLMTAKNDGFDYLIVQDADEFYLPEDYKKNIQAITSNPEHSLYQVKWILFWKNLNYILQYRKHKNKRNVTVVDCAVYAINLNKEVYFTNRRIINDMSEPFMLEGLCFHLSWVLSDQEVLRKISTWGHSHQVDIKRWYRWKWLAWEPSTKNLEVIGHIGVSKAIPYNGPLPEQVKEFSPLEQNFIRLSIMEKFFRWLNDQKYFIILLVKWPYYLLKYRRNIL